MAAMTLPHTVLTLCFASNLGEPLQSFSLSDKLAFDLCTELAMYCQTMTVTCPPDCIRVGYEEPSHYH